MQEMRVKWSLSWFLIIIIIMKLQMGGCRSCLDRERLALLELQAVLNLSTYNSSTGDFVAVSWPDDGKSDCCGWERIKCNATTGRVVELSLNRSIGTYYSSLNLSLFHPFEQLQSLDLSWNFLVGWFDDVEGFKSFGVLKKLKILDLYGNRFNNSILPFLSAAESLRTLNLSSNMIEGVFPSKEFANLRNLRVLDLSYSRLGLISAPEFANLRNLRSLNLRYNKLSLVPARGFKSFGVLKKLEILDLSVNEFNSSVLSFLSAAESLRTLSLASNMIEGIFPAKGICQMRNMVELDLSKNEFKGHIPSCLSNLTGLRVLDVTSNNFSGNLPSFLSDLTSLEYLSLYDNKFEGSFSFSSFAKLSKLKVFKLSSKPGLIQVKAENLWLPTFQLKILQLPSCNLKGEIPSFLQHQHDLRIIDLSDNDLVGAFPVWLLQNNPKLEVLILTNNAFTGFQLPEVVHGLRWLDISGNKISGSIPENIGMIFPKLEALNMSKNVLQGGIPSTVKKMKRLEKMDLSHNNFSEQLPKNFLSSCSALTILKLSNNSFEGEIFTEFANQTQLMVLLVDSNKFSGNIGRGHLNLDSLIILNISNNMFSGRIPDWIGRFARLEYLSMAKNHLEGEIPIQLQSLTDLRSLDLSENRLSGAIPSGFNLPLLRDLRLQNNDLTGPIPDALFNSTSLRTLDMRNNKLSGSIPKSLGKLSNLDVLLLQGNKISGQIPINICQLKVINFLDLSHNKLHGSVPSCLNNMSFGKGDDNFNELFAFEIGFGLSSPFYQYPSTLELPSQYEFIDVKDPQVEVQFRTKGRYEVFQGDILNYMCGLDLSQNELTGLIPPQIGDLQRLRALNLSHNRFSGIIPNSLSKLKEIESLDLSYNRLQGNIPSWLAELDSIGYFNVSFNNLSGTIPYKGHLTTFDETSYIGNPNLCGPPTNVTCGDSKVPKTSTSHHQGEDAEIDMAWFYWSLGATYVTTLLGTLVFFCIDTRWSRAWFYYVDVCIYHLEHLKRTYM